MYGLSSVAKQTALSGQQGESWGDVTLPLTRFGRGRECASLGSYTLMFGHRVLILAKCACGQDSGQDSAQNVEEPPQCPLFYSFINKMSSLTRTLMGSKGFLKGTLTIYTAAMSTTAASPTVPSSSVLSSEQLTVVVASCKYLFIVSSFGKYIGFVIVQLVCLHYAALITVVAHDFF